MQRQSNLPSVCVGQSIIKIHDSKTTRAVPFMFDTKTASWQALKSWRQCYDNVELATLIFSRMNNSLQVVTVFWAMQLISVVALKDLLSYSRQCDSSRC